MFPLLPWIIAEPSPLRSYHAFYEKAQRVRRLLCEDFDKVFAQEADVLLTPTSTSTAPQLARLAADGGDAMYVASRLLLPYDVLRLSLRIVAPCTSTT